MFQGFSLHLTRGFDGPGDGAGALVDHPAYARGEYTGDKHVEDGEQDQQIGDLAAPVLELKLRQTARAQKFGARLPEAPNDLQENGPLELRWVWPLYSGGRNGLQRAGPKSTRVWGLPARQYC